jgi:hypothetical protein
LLQQWGSAPCPWHADRARLSRANLREDPVSPDRVLCVSRDIYDLTALPVDLEGNGEPLGCLVQQELDFNRNIYRALETARLGGLDGVLCKLVCMIDKAGYGAQARFEVTTIRIAAHAGRLMVGPARAAKANTPEDSLKNNR